MLFTYLYVSVSPFGRQKRELDFPGARVMGSCETLMALGTELGSSVQPLLQPHNDFFPKTGKPQRSHRSPTVLKPYMCCTHPTLILSLLGRDHNGTDGQG